MWLIVHVHCLCVLESFAVEKMDVEMRLINNTNIFDQKDDLLW